ncbi:hypothetical protein K469DRAFT_710735 [Zopfia rhizophila CBS 207.26]|uniref:Uncharacterized protein n=1 Tax=Zopfia rhizophila CBS 207.26 TaxID=1314779 RepID=A0A6A6DVD4_9PEZI|nr:hypothetical protein K469DRAFT_710735 [Zopfia rhizophila CBS 207.26]
MPTCPKLLDHLYERYGRTDNGRSPPKKKAGGQAMIPVEEYKISERNATACHRFLAEAIYSSKVENPAFVRFLKHLRSVYTLPSRYRIADSLLTETYKETKEKTGKVLEKAFGQITLVSVSEQVGN